MHPCDLSTVQKRLLMLYVKVICTYNDLRDQAHKNDSEMLRIYHQERKVIEESLMQESIIDNAVFQARTLSLVTFERCTMN